MKSSLILLMLVVIFGTAPMLFIVGCKGKVEPTAGFEGPQVRGLSWQARALKAYMIAKRRFSPQSNELDVARERASVESMARMFKSLGAVRCTPVAANGVPAEWIVPEGLESDRVILYLHGGSFIAGSIVSHRTLAGNVALAARSRSLLLDYRLAPEHPFPAAIEDAVAGYEWLLAQGFAPAQIVVAGDSAGGNLSLSLLVYLRDHHRPLPAAAVCLSPVPDLTYASESWVFNLKKDIIANERMERLSVEVYLNGADPRTPLASPYFADLQGLPPLLIQVGSHEVILSDAMRFAEKAKQAGVEVTLEVWPGMQHVWQFAATLMPESRRAIFRIGEFIEEEFRKSLKDHDHIIGGVHRLNSTPEYSQPPTQAEDFFLAWPHTGRDMWIVNQADKELLRGIGAGKVQGASMAMTPTSTVRAARQIPRTSNRATPAGTAAAACTLVQLNHFLRPASVVGHQGQGDRLVLVSRIRVEVVQERAHLPNRGDHGNIRGRLLADLRVLDWR